MANKPCSLTRSDIPDWFTVEDGLKYCRRKLNYLQKQADKAFASGAGVKPELVGQLAGRCKTAVERIQVLFGDNR